MILCSVSGYILFAVGDLEHSPISAGAREKIACDLAISAK